MLHRAAFVLAVVALGACSKPTVSGFGPSLGPGDGEGTTSAGLLTTGIEPTGATDEGSEGEASSAGPGGADESGTPSDDGPDDGGSSSATTSGGTTDPGGESSSGAMQEPPGDPLDPSLDVPEDGEPCTTPGSLVECPGIAVCRFHTTEQGLCESCDDCGNLGAACNDGTDCDILFSCFEGRCTNFCHLGTFECGPIEDCLDIGHATHGVCDPDGI